LLSIIGILFTFISTRLQLMKTIILDDEQPAVQILSVFVKKIPFLDLTLATTNAFEAIDTINNQSIHLLLLDIEMPDLTGIELLNALEQKPMVIFTTAYEQYALKGYELDVVDYLVKPIRFDRFLKGINKAHKLYQSKQTPLPTNKEDFLLVKVDYKTVRIAYEDIRYIEGLKDYVKIFTTNEMILTRLNLKGIEEKLPANQFIRVHRSFIASLSKITAFQKSQISMGDQVLPIGDTYKAQLLDKLR